MQVKKRNGNENHILQDIALILFSVLIAVLLVRTNVLASFLVSIGELEIVSAFVAGMFFTSIFTTAPAIITLGEISLLQGIFSTALFGAMGERAGGSHYFPICSQSFLGTCGRNYDASECLATLPPAVQASLLPLDNISRGRAHTRFAVPG